MCATAVCNELLHVYVWLPPMSRVIKTETNIMAKILAAARLQAIK